MKALLLLLAAWVTLAGATSMISFKLYVPWNIKPTIFNGLLTLEVDRPTMCFSICSMNDRCITSVYVYETTWCKAYSYVDNLDLLPHRPTTSNPFDRDTSVALKLDPSDFNYTMVIDGQRYRLNEKGKAVSFFIRKDQ
uniref:Apple domain-containing protein n=1 Tax=Caenorhabditis tropicalis TaxID=1561998 RepID=A0A1I7UWH5_9PELO